MSRKIETLTSADCKKLLDAAGHGYPTKKVNRTIMRNYALTLLLLDAGLRVGELCKLELRDLYWNGEPTKSLVIRPEITKTKTERIIPISTQLWETLRWYIATLPSAGVLQGSRPAFSAGDGKTHLSVRQVQRIIEGAGLRGIGRKIHPHLLRHTFATRLMKILDIRGVQTLLGHKSVSSTQIYTHPDAEGMKTAIESASNGSTPDR